MLPRQLDIGVLLAGAMCAANRILFAIHDQLPARRFRQINIQLVAELQQIQQDICRLGGNFGFLLHREISALLFGQPLEGLKQLGGFHRQGRSEILWRVKLRPITLRGEVAQGLGQGLKIVVLL